MRKLPPTKVEFDTFPLTGGLDLHTPQLNLKQGIARAAQNFECSVNGGYTRIPGYERYSGQTGPSTAAYTVMLLTAVAGIAVGDACNDATSGATGVVAAISGLNVIITKIVGTFGATHIFRKAPATAIGTITTASVGVTNQTTAATYALAAADIYRADILAPTGTGGILGGFVLSTSNYCFRVNAGAVVLYKASSSGWTAVTLGWEVGFTGTGVTVAPTIGGTITKGAVSAVVRAIVITSGAWGGTVAGKFITDAPTGGTFTTGALTSGAANVSLANLVTVAAPSAAITLAGGGRFEIDIGDAGNGTRVYWTDGVNRLCEFDGTTVVPIDTGLSPDAPLHCKVHARHVVISKSTTAQYSGTGTPYVWSVVLGAAAISVSTDITGFLVLPGNSTTTAVAILSNDNLSILYGIGTSSVLLTELKLGVGCKAYAAQLLTQGYIYDDLGIVSLQAVQAYGNFVGNSLTVNIRSFVQARRTQVTDSMINREKSQYRVYYSDGYALYTTIVNGNLVGCMPMVFPNPVSVCWRAASVNGNELSYFGSTNGMVYQMETGTSFDGAAIASSLDLAFAAQGNSRTLKTYRKAALEIQGSGYVEFLAGTTMGYGDVDAISASVPASTTPAYWDAFTWDAFTWDGRNITPSTFDVVGTSENISCHVESTSALWPTFTINSASLHYTPRRVLR